VIVHFYAAVFTLFVDGSAFYSGKIDSYVPPYFHSRDDCERSAPARILGAVRERVSDPALRERITFKFACVYDSYVRR
jgi:hypothetical protein